MLGSQYGGRPPEGQSDGDFFKPNWVILYFSSLPALSGEHPLESPAAIDSGKVHGITASVEGPLQYCTKVITTTLLKKVNMRHY